MADIFTFPKKEEQLQSKDQTISYDKTNNGYKKLSFVVNFKGNSVKYITRLVKVKTQYEEIIREEVAYDIEEAKLQYKTIDKTKQKILIDVTGNENEFENITKAQCRKTGEMYKVSLTYDRRGVDVYLYKDEWSEQEEDSLSIYWHNEFNDTDYIPYKEQYNV